MRVMALRHEKKLYSNWCIKPKCVHAMWNFLMDNQAIWNIIIIRLTCALYTHTWIYIHISIHCQCTWKYVFCCNTEIIPAGFVLCVAITKKYYENEKKLTNFQLIFIKLFQIRLLVVSGHNLIEILNVLLK